MERTIRASPEQWSVLLLAWAGASVALALLAFEPHPRRSIPGLILSALPIAVMVGRLTAETVSARVVVGPGRVAFHSCLRSRRRTFATSEILRYQPVEKHGWAALARDKSAFVPVEEPWDVHAAVVEHARGALKTKRLRVRRSPPAEDLRGLGAVDLRRPPGSVLVFGLGFLAVGAILHDAAGLLVSAALIALVALLRLSDRLDLTHEALVLHSPFGDRRIAWEETTALFCEDPKGRPSFVVTAPGRGIHVPSHLIRRPEVRRKLVFSLPDGTPCVNFEEFSPRRLRRKRRPTTRPARLAASPNQA